MIPNYSFLFLGHSGRYCEQQKPVYSQMSHDPPIARPNHRRKGRAAGSTRDGLATCWSLLVFVLLLRFGQTTAQANTLSFEGLNDSDILTTQYPGLTFTNAIILTAGISLNEFEFPPSSGVNVLSDNGGPITITFASPVTAVSGYFTYLTTLTLVAFGSGSNQLGQTSSAYGTNLALSGEPGSSSNEFLTLSFPTGIANLTLAGDAVGGSFVLDDLSYSPLSSASPEPASILLFFTVTAMMAVARLKRNL